MSTPARRDWNVLDEKRAAIIDVLKHVMSQPPEVGQRCVQDDQFARSLFEDPAIGNVSVPPHAKTVFMPRGELERKGKGSVVIELPETQGTMKATTNPEDLLKYVLCCYIPW
jgi:hypothetical protein